MSQEIAVIGSPEFTTGFRLAGVQTFENVPTDQKDDELDAAVERVLDDDDVGIIVMHDEDMEYLSRGQRKAVEGALADDDVGIVVMRDEDLDHLSRTVRRDVEGSVEPVLVTLGGGAGSGGLRGQIKRAIGIDLMEDED